jgi:Flp pilus assembly protein TadG
MRRLAIIKSDDGSVAVEFAMLLPALAMLIVGILSAGLVMYSASGLHGAVEAAARCHSVNGSQCSTASAAQTCAQSSYYGVGSPTFMASTPSCGHQVSATLSVVFNAAIAPWTIPLSATPCFP